MFSFEHSPRVDIRVREVDRWQTINLGRSFSRNSLRQNLRGNRNQLGMADVENCQIRGP